MTLTINVVTLHTVS